MLSFKNACWTWFLGIACISVNTLFVGVANAQITPDTTLPNNSDVKLEGNINKIEGGTTAGSNLFHSFKEFSVTTGSEAHFNNAVDINNIITRVTGKSISNIDGLIKANGTANLFLINPSGIVFGENASLDIGGSFVGSTADAIGFGENDFFSASSPEDSSSLLEVNPNALFFNQIKAASIENNSVADAGLNASGDFTVRGLRVPDGKSLMLVGGDINMDGGGLLALGGKVELGGLAGKGTVGLNRDRNNLSLNFPSGVERSDVSLKNGANVAVIAENSGSIAVNARNLEMIAESFLFSGIESGLGSDNSKAGNTEINITGEVNLKKESLIGNNVLSGASGEGGDININANTLKVDTGSKVTTTTSGNGKGGDLNVKTQNIQLTGESVNGQIASGLVADSDSIGNAGDLTIKTNTLLVEDGARVSTGTFGQGQGGNLTIEAKDIQLTGSSADGQFPGGLFARTGSNSIGDAGDLTIKTNTIIVRNLAQVSVSSFGQGKGGDLIVNAQEIQLIGTRDDGLAVSGLFASTLPSSTGDAGDLRIKTSTLLVKDGATVSVSSFGKGNGGNLIVDAQDIQLIGTSIDGRFDSGLFSSVQPTSTGDAGNITVKTNTLLLEDEAQISAGTFGQSKGGNLTIETNSLLLRNGGQIGAGTFAQGKGGSLTINAKDIKLIGTNRDGKFGSGVFTSAQPTSSADAGDLTIKTNTLVVQDGAQVSSSSFGKGNGGDLTIDTKNVQLIGKSENGLFVSGLFAEAEEAGNAGNLTVKTNVLQVEDEATVNVQSSGTGAAGNMILNARSIRLNNNASLTANTQSPNTNPEVEQATININSQDLILRRGSNIFTNAQGENVVGGNININSGVIAAIPIENSDISANSDNFRGGNIRIQSQGIYGTQFRDELTPKSDITATGANPDLSGFVEIITPDINPNSGLVNLPTIPVETEVAQVCAAGSPVAQSKFEIIGTRGLPSLPSEALTTDAILVDLVTLKPELNQNPSARVSIKPSKVKPKKIVEATGFMKNQKGEIFLVADADGTNAFGWNKNVGCGGGVN